MSLRAAAIVVVAALLAAACGEDPGEPPPLVTAPTTVPAAADSTVGPAATDADPAAGIAPVVVEQVDCPDELARDDGLALACGVATVLLDRTDPNAGTTVITLATLAGSDTDDETPVAVLQGGPGGASSDLGGWFPRQPFTQVFVDQRGTGFAGPDLDCPEIDTALGVLLAEGSAAAAADADAAYAGCARRLGADPVLAHVDTEAHAADVVDVMAALGYRRWAAYGVSYGSTIGLELLHDEPDGLVAVVLDGVYPPDLDTDAGLVHSATRALAALDAACAAEAACRAGLADGSVATTLARVMDELDAAPMVVPLSAARVGWDAPIDVVLDGGRVAEFTFLTMYHESLLRFLPAVIAGLDDRDETAARWLARIGTRLQIGSQEANDEGTYFAVQCHDRLPFTDGPGDPPDAFAAAIVPVGLAELCAEWDRGVADDRVGEPVSSSIPTLLLSGEFDPITPPEYAEAVAARLDAATVVTQAGRGHGIWYGDDCIADLVRRFVDSPDSPLDTGCANDPVPVEWARP